MRKQLWILPLAAMVIAAGCGEPSTTSAAKDSGPAQVTEPTPVKAEKRDIVGYEFLNGQLVLPASAQGVALANYSAPVKTVMATVGQRVRKGEVVAHLDAPSAETDYAQARSDVKLAEAALASATAQANAPVKQLEIQRDALRSREKALRSATDPSGDASELVTTTTARQALDQQILEARANANQQLVQYKQQLELARTQLKGAKADARQASITAPVSGTVVRIDAQPGQTIRAGQQVAQIADLERMQIQATVPSDQAANVKEDRKVVIKFADLPNQPFEGTVRAIQTLPNNGSVDRVATIAVKNAQGLVKPGMKVASIGIEVGKATSVVAVPVQALKKDEQGRPYVKVLDGKDWKQTIVETGLSDGEYIEIKNGVKEGDTVLVAP